MRQMRGIPCKTYSFVVFESVLILVGLLAANNGAPEWLGFFVGENDGGIGDTSQQLLFADSSCNIAIRAVLSSAELEVGVRGTHAATGAEEPLGWLVNAKIDHVIIVPIETTELILVLAHGVILHTEITKSTHHTFVHFGRGPWSG